MIAWVWLRNPREFAGCFPVKVSAIYDYTADCCTMSADKFSCGMNHNVSAILDRANQIRCCKCRIHYKRNVMFMCNLCNFFDINQVGVRVSKCFNKDCFCVFLDCSFEGTFYFRIYKCCGNAVCLWKGMCQKVWEFRRRWSWKLQCAHLFLQVPGMYRRLRLHRGSNCQCSERRLQELRFSFSKTSSVGFVSLP